GQTSGSLAYASGRRIPVLMAASGPKATELAGEIADGVLLSVGFHPKIVAAVLSHLEAGARRGGGGAGGPRGRRAGRGGGGGHDRPSCIRPCSAHGRTGSRTPASRCRSSTSRRRFGLSTPIWPTRATGSRRSRRRRSFRMT